eukprot:8808930-Lingulodinium_polyedra.AAC.1
MVAKCGGGLHGIAAPARGACSSPAARGRRLRRRRKVALAARGGAGDARRPRSSAVSNGVHS